MNTAKFPTSVRLSMETKMALQKHAAREDRAEAWVIERALVDYLRRSGDLPEAHTPLM
jgi:predicted transcriptional regulator